MGPGIFAVAAEMVEDRTVKPLRHWITFVKSSGYLVSLVLLVTFLGVIIFSRSLWNGMFHLIRINTGFAFLLCLATSFAAEFTLIQGDRHLNATVSSLTLFFQSSVSTLLALECVAYFRAITQGVIGGLAKAYAFIGWGLPTVLLGLTWFLHGNDIGTDPECFIGWESQTKFPQYSYMFGCSGVGITLSLITLLNIELPVMWKESAVEPLVTQTWGMAAGVTLNSMGVLFSYYYSMRDPDAEVKDFSGINWIFRTWSGLFCFVCLGLASEPFKNALIGQARKKANLLSILSEITEDSAKIRSPDSSIDEEFDKIDDDNESVSSGSEVSSDSLDEESN